VFSLFALSVERAGAQPTLSRSASILYLPRVVAESSRDTVIEIANVSNSSVSAICLYLDGASGLQVNFQADLIRQSSARWTASQGLLCPGPQCNFFRGLIPPLPLPFAGALTCIEVEPNGSPLAGDHLVLGATVVDLATGDTEAYEAIGLSGFETGDGDPTLCLGGSDPTDECPLGPEYAGCPDEWILNHVAEGSEDPLAGPGSSVNTTLTFVNCGQDFEEATAPDVPLQFTITNELEQNFSASTTVASWAETSLEEIGAVFGADLLGTTYAQTRIRAVQGGVAIVAREERRTAGQTTASAAFSLAHTGLSLNRQTIVVHPSLLGP
jgi:hypothetical protein